MAEHSLYVKKVSSALFFAFASFSLTMVNKSVLTVYGFPSFQVLGLSQMATTVLILSTCRRVDVIQIKTLSRDSFMKMLPLAFLFFGSSVSGLGATKYMSLPMFTALRRFSIIITMLMEKFLLKIVPSSTVVFSVIAMVAGALVAASDDVTFTGTGYSLVFISNVYTATNMVMLKLNLDSKDLSAYDITYYNSLFSVAPMLLLSYASGDLSSSYDFKHWKDLVFLLQFVMSSFIGCVLNYSIATCTLFNGALTTTIIGCLKNISVTYIGVLVGGDYVFTRINFAGLNISVLGSILYTYVTFRRKDESKFTPIGKHVV